MSAATWEFEAADPEVGFLTDTITHTCAANVEADAFEVEAAIVKDVSHANVQRNGETVVAETTVFECPKCKATTACTEHWPLWFFESEPGGDQ